MNNYRMPYLFILTDEELSLLFTAYRTICHVATTAQERNNIRILDDEFRSGAKFRADEVTREAERREQQFGFQIPLIDEFEG